MRRLRPRLMELAEASYREFARRLIPGEPRLLGVRLPRLREIAKEEARAGAWRLRTGDDAYVEELMLRGMAIGYARGVGLPERLRELERFVPLIDNWSVCDSSCSTYAFARAHREAMWEWLQGWLRAREEYAARFGAVMLLMHYKQEKAWAERVAAALPQMRAEAYYAEMAAGWCACELCLLYPELAPGLLSSLRERVRRMAQRKLRESRRKLPPGALI